ncbi:MAG: SGNH/GDSL hydrolase family protein [Gammaproteobacteria bacterium]
MTKPMQLHHLTTHCPLHSARQYWISAWIVFWASIWLPGCVYWTENPPPASQHAQTLNHYDDAWENRWVSHLQSIYKRTSLAGGDTVKTPGFVVHLGDSMTYANAYGQVSEHGVHDFQDTVIWSQSQGGNDSAPNNKNGWQLARFDHPVGGRSYTAISGITAHHYLYGNSPSGNSLHGDGQHNVARPPYNPYSLKTVLANRVHAFDQHEIKTANPNETPPPPIAQLHDSVIAIVLLGSNDIAQGRTPEAIAGDLKNISVLLIEADIMPVLSTIPPRYGLEAEVMATNHRIQALAQELALPLIGFWEEVTQRQPKGQWFGTLISDDGIHPTATPYRDPSQYPDILNQSGYTLRGYLTILKLDEIRKKVITAIK